MKLAAPMGDEGEPADRSNVCWALKAVFGLWDQGV